MQIDWSCQQLVLFYWLGRVSRNVYISFCWRVANCWGVLNISKLLTNSFHFSFWLAESFRNAISQFAICVPFVWALNNLQSTLYQRFASRQSVDVPKFYHLLLLFCYIVLNFLFVISPYTHIHTYTCIYTYTHTPTALNIYTMPQPCIIKISAISCVQYHRN